METLGDGKPQMWIEKIHFCINVEFCITAKKETSTIFHPEFPSKVLINILVTIRRVTHITGTTRECKTRKENLQGLRPDRPLCFKIDRR